MKNKRIENPKVFISYAWADDDYQNLVLAFATQLVNDGIDVIFDKWDLTEGNDTFAFMEKCATDPSVTNVLMLLDPVYANKADEHTGGVGTETQIISAKVYNEVTQDKFIPVVMKRDADGHVCKPTYLQGRLHFDLSVPEKYDETYRRLVKKLYGIENYVKPELGVMPSWVEDPIVPTPKTVITYDVLKNTMPIKVKCETLSKFLHEISLGLVNFTNKPMTNDRDPEEYLTRYDETVDYRTRFLQLLKNAVYIEDHSRYIADFFEETTNSLSQNSLSSIVRIRIHEFFIYTVAYFLTNKDYSTAGYLLGKTYFNNNQRTNRYGADNYNMFYSGQDHQILDKAIKTRDNKNYYTGTGCHWLETLDAGTCTRKQFILADLICFNYSVYGIGYNDSWPWFPITYVYDKEFNSVLEPICKKMVSREYVSHLLPLFGYKIIDELKEKMQAIEQGRHRDIRYPEAFDSAPLLYNFIKAEDVGTFL